MFSNIIDTKGEILGLRKLVFAEVPRLHKREEVHESKYDSTLSIFVI